MNFISVVASVGVESLFLTVGEALTFLVGGAILFQAVGKQDPGSAFKKTLSEYLSWAMKYSRNWKYNDV